MRSQHHRLALPDNRLLCAISSNTKYKISSSRLLIAKFERNEHYLVKLVHSYTMSKLQANADCLKRPNLEEKFSRCWEISTADNNLTLHGFRRFKTTHLMNLRYLEDEIAAIDHTIYQAGIGLGLDSTSVDRLSLKDCKKDAVTPKVEEAITHDLMKRLRVLLKEYGMC
jgi:hypothetical protein